MQTWHMSWSKLFIRTSTLECVFLTFSLVDALVMPKEFRQFELSTLNTREIVREARYLSTSRRLYSWILW